MILKGFDDEEIIEAISVSLSSVKRWRAKLKTTNDLQILVRKDGTGRTPLLSEEQSERLKVVIAGGAIAAGYDEERWTSRIIAKLIKEKFDVDYAPRSVRFWMKRHGFIPIADSFFVFCGQSVLRQHTFRSGFYEKSLLCWRSTRG